MLGAVLELSKPIKNSAALSEAGWPPGFDFYGPVPTKMLLNKRSSWGNRPHICALEFADLSDGQRVELRNDRGWCHWPPNTTTSRWQIANGREITKMAHMILHPCDDDEWERWIVEELRQVGIEVDRASVHAAPYRVEFGPSLQDMLRRPKQQRSPT